MDERALRAAIRNQVADDYCWLDDSELGKMIPREEFLESCSRYHAQITGERGTTNGCMTISQLEARIIVLEDTITNAIITLASTQGVSRKHAIVALMYRLQEARSPKTANAKLQQQSSATLEAKEE